MWIFSSFRLVELFNEGIKLNFTSYIELCKLLDFRPLQQRSKWSIFLICWIFFGTAQEVERSRGQYILSDFFRLLDLSTAWEEVLMVDFSNYRPYQAKSPPPLEKIWIGAGGLSARQATSANFWRGGLSRTKSFSSDFFQIGGGT